MLWKTSLQRFWNPRLQKLPDSSWRFQLLSRPVPVGAKTRPDLGAPIAHFRGCLNAISSLSSDVVARSEPPSAPSPASTQSSESPLVYPQEEPCFTQSISPFKQNKPCTKPTMYVEPYKPIDLGPIGSRRMGTPDSMSPVLFNHEGKFPKHRLRE